MPGIIYDRLRSHYMVLGYSKRRHSI